MESVGYIQYSCYYHELVKLSQTGICLMDLSKSCTLQKQQMLPTEDTFIVTIPTDSRSVAKAVHKLTSVWEVLADEEAV